MPLRFTYFNPCIFYRMTTAERDAQANWPDYATIHNTTVGRVQQFIDEEWVDVAQFYGTPADEDTLIWDSAEARLVPKTPAEVLAILSGEASAAFAMNSQKITGLTAGAASGEAVEYDQLQDELWAGIDDGNLVRIDHEEGAEEGDFARFTDDGVEPLSPAELLEALSGQADDPFDYNDQEVRNVRKLFLGDDRVEARWHLTITVEDPAANDTIPFSHHFDGRATITDVKDATIGASTTADYNLEWRPTLNGTGTDVFASDVQATNTDTHRKAEDFDSPGSSSTGGWLVAAISAVSGTAPDFLAVTVRGTHAP